MKALFKMLDAFEIITTSGVVLWSKTYVPVGEHIVNSLIKDVFIEEKAGAEGASQRYSKEKYTLKWRLAKDFGLIFVVSARSFCLFAVQRILIHQFIGSIPVPTSLDMDRRTARQHKDNLRRSI